MSVQIAPLSESLPLFLQETAPTQLAVLVDEHTRRHCYSKVKPLLPKHTLIQIKSGEGEKHLDTADRVWQALTDAAFDRHGLLLNLGGGVIGDLGGFCAATYKRGIAFAQLPTTLLSQVDASVGGKLGVDFGGLKNHIGVFQIPDAVLIDPVFLETLPPRELRSGFAEVVKHCLIADAAMWQRIRSRDLTQQNFPELIAHSVALKQRITTEDPTEKGLRKILNFGHTLGHAIETHFLSNPKKRLLHGEAIAAGMLAESYLSHRRGWLDAAPLAQIEEFVFSVFGKITLQDSDFDPILFLTRQDKKNRGGQVRFALLDGLGSCRFDVPVMPAEMRRALRYYVG